MNALQLKTFLVTYLHIDWHQVSDTKPEVFMTEGKLSFDYDVLRSNENSREFALKLRFISNPADEESENGYKISTEIVGFFEFPASMPEKEMQYLIRVNGSTILYGILRGQLSLFTASFPGGQYILPPVYMQDVVKDIDGTHYGQDKNDPL